MPVFPPATDNRLLALLAPSDLESLLPKLTPVTLGLQQSLWRSDEAIEAVYFPLSSMISLIARLDDGTQAEVGVIGREGVLGTSLLSGVDTSFMEAMAQMPGPALRMTVRDFRQEAEVNPAFRRLILRYREAVQSQIMQTAACNGRHNLKQRLARWLLMAHDRAGGDTLHLTHEFLAMMLGIHRASVTETASSFRQAGLIRYASGRIDVVDRPGLEAVSCECYGTVQRRVRTLLGNAEA